MELLKWCMILGFHLTQTKGQNFNCSLLIPDGLSNISAQASSQLPYSIQVTPMDDYVLGSQIQVTVELTPPMSSSFTSVYMAAENKANNGYLGTWNYPVEDAEYSSFECFGGATVIAFRSNVSTTTLSFTWSSNAEIPTQGFFFKATIVEVGTTYWTEVSSVTVHVEFTCFEDAIYFPSDVGVFVIIRDPVCSRQMSLCNGTLQGSYPIGNHTIQCNCTAGTGSTDTCDISFEVEPPDISCPEPSDVKLSTLPNGNIIGNWENTCIDLEGNPESVTCNVTQGDSLSPGDNFIACNCTDKVNLNNSCVFALDVPTNCPLPNVEYSVLNCSAVQSVPQTNCSLDCVDNRVKAIPNYGPISCRSNMWEPPIFDTLCQNRVDFITRSIFIYVPVTTSARNCSELLDLEMDISTFFGNIFEIVLTEFCSTLEMSGGCNQSTSLEVGSNCSQIVTLNITSTLDTRSISEIAENFRDMLQGRNDISSIPLKNTNYTASLTEQNKQEISISELAFNCSSGYANVGNQYCVLCPPGTYLTVLNGACELCDVGTYQDEAGQFICKGCSSSDLPGSAKCIVPTMEIPDDGELSLLLLAVIILAGVLTVFVICLLCVTCYFCQGGGDKTIDQPIEFTDTRELEVRAYDNNIPTERSEVDVVLRDYAGRTESDDDDDTSLGRGHQYDSPPGTPTDLEERYGNQDITEL